MSWKWGNASFASGGYRNSSVPVGGGRVGSVAEAGEKKTWPEYDAQYLKHALNKADRKYSSAGLLNTDGEVDETLRHVYLDNVSRNYKNEAEQALKQEFELWLQGIHPANNGDNLYSNGEGRPVRRWTYQQNGVGGGAAGDIRDGWRHTNWGKAQLTHLPGVRPYLRAQYEDGMNDEIKMNMLAEHGPQDLDQAWMYFKHWVKGRPVSDATPLVIPRTEGQNFDHRAPWFNRMPHSMETMDTEQLQATPEVTGSEQTSLPPYGGSTPATTIGQSRAVDDWQANLDLAKRRAKNISARVALQFETPERRLVAAQRDVDRVQYSGTEARVQEWVENVNSEARQAARNRDELQNDATREGLNPDRDGDVLVAQEEGTIASLERRQQRIDLAAAKIGQIQEDIRKERLSTPGSGDVVGPGTIVSRPGWPVQPSQVF